jgi:hypothetical protein
LTIKRIKDVNYDLEVLAHKKYDDARSFIEAILFKEKERRMGYDDINTVLNHPFI